MASSIDALEKEKNLLWNSGVVNSDSSILVPYAGDSLAFGKSIIGEFD